MESFSLSNDEKDVLNTVPPLPTLHDNDSAAIAAAHYAPPRRISVVAANESESVQRFRGINNSQFNDSPAGPIHLRIARSSIPARIQNGIEELAKHAPRRNIHLTNEEIKLAPALDKRQDDNPIWWWNIW